MWRQEDAEKMQCLCMNVTLCTTLKLSIYDGWFAIETGNYALLPTPKVVFLSLLIVAYTDGRGEDTTDAPAHQACVQAPPATTYWTGWYSTSDNFAKGSSEDFSHLCSNIEETQCREKYTHRSLDDTGVIPYVMCNDGVLSCGTALQSCENAEVRLLCTNTNDTLPEPDLHWSLSELDSGATMGANESWTCNDKVVRVDPIAGTMVGEVVLGSERLRQSYGPSSHYDLCAVRTSYASLAFKPFVQNCLTNPDCCDSAHGISVMFWLQKNEMNGNESRSQSSPRHAFRSPSLVATVQNGHLIVTYLHLDTTWTVNPTLIDKEWVHVTITFDPLTNLTVYFNSEVKGQGIPTTTSQPFADILDEFEKDNTSFWVFSRDDVVTSSEIRPLMMTELKVFYSALSADLVRRIFQNEREDGPPKVLRMAISQKSFTDSVTQKEVHHIKLTCLIRAQNGSDLNVRFMYEEDYGHFEELTSNEFFMTSYLQEQNEYRTTAVLYIFGDREHTAGYLPSRFTCEVVSDSQLSAYGYPIVETYESTDLDETDDYYWTGFFNAGTPAGGDETETKDMHLAMAKQEEYSSLCQNPIYAECRTTLDSDGQRDSDGQPWYEISPSFVPDFNYPCDGNGIRCSVDGDAGHIQSTFQECPDLQVRYACPVTSATVPYSTSMSGIGKIDTSHTTTSGNDGKETPFPRTPDTISGGVEDPMSTRRSDIDTPTTTRSSSINEVTRDSVGGIGSPPESTTSSVSPRSSPPPDTRPDIVHSTRQAQDTSTSTTPDVSTAPDIVPSTRRAQDTSTSTTPTIATIAPDTKSSTTVEQVQDTSTRTARNDVSTAPDAPTTTRPSTKSKPDESRSPADEDASKTTTLTLGDTSTVPSTMETSVGEG
ncbi:uncharacterized protein LOC105436473 [Strongylocentrotus purpuratus]|uniref:WxxW domain-containing protein n=1 Tax=Strongylocentrotus purpuratus TaxID=7668 RepID=A0A7M7NP37_STRPU|nr:uncharacterized protein LOC105436473 [Strongylocentrotus purpuratus]